MDTKEVICKECLKPFQISKTCRKNYCDSCRHLRQSKGQMVSVLIRIACEVRD